MKIKVLMVMLGLLFFVASGVWAIDVDNGDIPLVGNEYGTGGECGIFASSLNWNPFDSSDAANIDWSPAKWQYPQAKNWSPSVMGARVGADGNIAVRFIMTTEDVDFFKNARFNGTNIRVPFALEIDVVDHNGALGVKRAEDFKIVEDNLPGEAMLSEDISNFDKTKALGMIIFQPAKLEADTVYQIVINPNNTANFGVIHVNFQLTVNYKWISAMVNNYSNKCDILDFMGNFKGDNISGYNIAIGSNSDFSNIPSKAIDPWYYYLAAETDASNKVSFRLNVENNAVCWNDHENVNENNEPLHNRSSFYGYNGEFDHLVSYKGEAITDWCILDDNDVNLWRLGIGSKYYYNHTTIDSNGNVTNDSQKENDELPGSTTSSDPSKSSTKPDLFIKQFYLGDGGITHYYDDENVHLYAQVKNVGKDVSTSITNITLKYYRFRGEKINGDLKELGSDKIQGSSLASGKTKTEDLSSGVPDTEDKYQYYACIDTGKTVSENNENNNCNSNSPIAIRVHKRPDLAVRDLTLDGGATTFEEGTTPYAQVTIENTGGEPFDDVPVHWYLDGAHYADDNMRHWNITHGDVKHEDVYLPGNLSSGLHTVKSCYDLPDDKDNSDECLELSFEITKKEPPNNLLRADVNGDGNITTADSQLITRYSTGNDMSSTAWIDSPITGDADCNGVTNSTDALLVMRKSMGMSMTGTAWCLGE